MLVVANLVATVVRFLLFRAWVFAHARAAAIDIQETPRHDDYRPRVLPRRRKRRPPSADRPLACGTPDLCAALLVADRRRSTCGAWAPRATANDFYAAAVQAGTKSWKALLLGSFDASNLITVDKPPASLWVMELSGADLRVQLPGACWCPQALEGVAAVWLLYLTVRRWSRARRRACSPVRSWR